MRTTLPAPSALLAALCCLGGSARAQGAPTPADVDPWSLVRVDVPDLPDAICTSETGSVLLTPPDDLPWRVEELGVPQVFELDEDELAATQAQAVPEEGDALEGLGDWVAWEGEAAMHVAAWQDAGFDGSYPDGSKVKVAIFDVQWYGEELATDELVGTLQTHDCFAHKSCQVPIDSLNPRYSWELGSHGLACAQIISDLAPGVELHLVKVAGVTSLENAVDWAIREGIDVVSMSMSFFNNSFYDGSGPVSALMDRLEAGGVLMVTSAGNYADQHWRGRFHDTDSDGFHEFFSDRTTLPIWMHEGVQRVQLIWDDFGACGRTDLDAWLLDGDGDVLGHSDGRQVAGDDGCSPTERVRAELPADGWYYFAVERHAGQPDADMDVLTRDGEVWHGIAAGSVTDPGAHPAVLTVGAVRAVGYADNGPEFFSSVGPTNGGVDKPDISGPDGISTSVYGPTGFYGTSAATPSVAAAVVLMMSSEPGIDAFEAAARLRGHVLSDSKSWQSADPALGAGKLRLAGPSSSSGTGCASAPAAPMAFTTLPLSIAALLRRRRERARGPAGRLPATPTPPGARP